MNRKLLFMIFALSVGVLFGQSDWAIAVPKLLVNINRGGIQNIGVIDTDGKNLRIFTDDPKKIEFDAVWSPNGQHIAFATIPHIMLMNADGKNIQNLTEPLGIIGFARNPTWSPDGKSLAFVVEDPKDIKTCNIYVVDLDGKNLRQLTHDISICNGQPIWSPNGSKIAYVRRKEQNPPEIFVMDMDGKNKKQITKGWDVFPTWSPDGKKIAYVRKEGDINPFHLWVMEANGDNQHAIPIENAPPGLMVDRPLWLPDGRILFKRFGSKFSETYIVDEDGKNLTLLFDLKAFGLKEGENTVTVTSWFDPSLARSVSPAGKQATIWGQIKSTQTNRQGK